MNARSDRDLHSRGRSESVYHKCRTKLFCFTTIMDKLFGKVTQLADKLPDAIEHARAEIIGACPKHALVL